MCVFQISWAIYGVYAIIVAIYGDYPFLDMMQYKDAGYLFSFAISSIVLDIFIAGSEISHKIYHDKLTKEQKELESQKGQNPVEVVVTQPEL